MSIFFAAVVFSQCAVLHVRLALVVFVLSEVFWNFPRFPDIGGGTLFPINFLNFPLHFCGQGISRLRVETGFWVAKTPSFMKMRDIVSLAQSR